MGSSKRTACLEWGAGGRYCRQLGRGGNEEGAQTDRQMLAKPDTFKENQGNVKLMQSVLLGKALEDRQRPHGPSHLLLYLGKGKNSELNTVGTSIQRFNSVLKMTLT